MTDLLSLLESILGESKAFAHDEHYFFCPFCHHTKPKLAINLTKRKWHCWKCGNKGNRLISLLRRLDVSPNQIRELREVLAEEVRYVQDDKADAALGLPSEFKPLWKPSKEIERKHALLYLKERGVTAGDIISHNLGYCSSGHYQNRIIIPSYDETGKLNYFVGRDFFGNSHMPYLNPKVSKNVVGFESHINWQHGIVLVEGVFDAMAIKWNAIPLFGKYVPSGLRQKIVEHQVEKIYVALDADAASEALKIIQSFVKEGQQVYLVDTGDKDPSKVGFVGMRQHLKEARQMAFADILAMKLA